MSGENCTRRCTMATPDTLYPEVPPSLLQSGVPRVCGAELAPVSYRTILLSVISLLNEPNTFSPANVDASVMYRKWKESKGKDREYTDIIR